MVKDARNSERYFVLGPEGREQCVYGVMELKKRFGKTADGRHRIRAGAKGRYRYLSDVPEHFPELRGVFAYHRRIWQRERFTYLHSTLLYAAWRLACWPFEELAERLRELAERLRGLAQRFRERLPRRDPDPDLNVLKDLEEQRRILRGLTPEELRDIATSTLPGASYMAAIRLADEADLVKVAAWGECSTTCKTAFRRLSTPAAWTEVAQRTACESVSERALAKIEDDALLAKVVLERMTNPAWSDSRTRTVERARRQALEKIRDEHTLVEIACSSSAPTDLRQAAIARVRSPSGQLELVLRADDKLVSGIIESLSRELLVELALSPKTPGFTRQRILGRLGDPAIAARVAKSDQLETDCRWRAVYHCDDATRLRLARSSPDENVAVAAMAEIDSDSVLFEIFREASSPKRRLNALKRIRDLDVIADIERSGRLTASERDLIAVHRALAARPESRWRDSRILEEGDCLALQRCPECYAFSPHFTRALYGGCSCPHCTWYRDPPSQLSSRW